MAPYTKLFDIGQIIGAPIATLITFRASTHPYVDWRIMIGTVYVFLIPLSILSITFTYFSEAEHHFEVEPVSYKKLSSPRARLPLIISHFLGYLTMLSAVGAVQFYGPLTFRSADLSPYKLPLVISIIQAGLNLASMCLPKAFGREYLLCLAATVKLVYDVTTSSSYSMQLIR